MSDFLHIVESLVLISIHDNSSCIAVRIDYNNDVIQVVDNGEGTEESQLKFLSSSRNHHKYSVVEKHQNWSYIISLIIKDCSSLIIESQNKETSLSFRKLYKNKVWSDIVCVGKRPTSGTSITITYDSLSLSLKNGNVDVGQLQNCLRKIVAGYFLLFPHISFSLRFDPSKPPLLQTKKARNTMHAVQQLFEFDKNSIRTIPFHGRSQHFRVKGLLVLTNKETVEHCFVYVNGRLAESRKITNFINSALQNLPVTQDQELTVLLNIKCSSTECVCRQGTYGIRIVSFIRWNEILSLIERTVINRFFLHLEASLLTCFSSSIPLSVNSETCGIDYNRDFNGFHSALEDLERVILVDGKSKFKQINTQIANLVERRLSRMSPSASSDYGVITYSMLTPYDLHATQGCDLRVKVHANITREYGPRVIETVNLENPLKESYFWTEDLVGHIAKGNSTCSNTTNMESASLNRKRAYFLNDIDLSCIAPKSKKEATCMHIINAFDSKVNFWTQPVFPTNIALNKLKYLEVAEFHHECKFSKSSIRNMAVVTQIDRKFICCIAHEEKRRYLLLIDQHAAHERICLEKLMHSHSNIDAEGFIQINSSSLHPHLQLPFHVEDLEIIKQLDVEFCRYGLGLQHKDSSVLVTHAPTCFLAREIGEIQRGRGSLYKELVKELIEETVMEFKRNGRVDTCLLPSSVRNVLNSLACHGAIKFGDALSQAQCAQLVKSLAHCDTPFQCAHGRPLLVPLLELGNLFSVTTLPPAKPNYSRIKNGAVHSTS